jgi:hypothetical protein
MATWLATVDDVGRTYFYDPQSRQARWEPPENGNAPYEDASTRWAMPHEAQEEIDDHVRIHLASKLRTCLCIGRDVSLRGAFQEWRCVCVFARPRCAFVRPMARAISAWMIQRDRTLAAIAGSMLLEDYVEVLNLRIEALESAERAQAEFERLSSSARAHASPPTARTRPRTRL